MRSSTVRSRAAYAITVGIVLALTLAGAAPASSAGSVSVTSVGFSAGQTLTGSITWTAQISGTPNRVDFAIDGNVLWTTRATPYTFNGNGGTLNTTALTNGSHTFTVTASPTPGKGNNVSASIDATVSNGVVQSALPTTTSTPTTTTSTTTTTTSTTTSSGTTTTAAAATTTTAAATPSGSWWSWDAQTATLDPNSASLMQTFLGYAVVNPNMTLYDWGVAVADTAPTSPCYAVPVTDGGTLDSSICIPLGTKPDPSGDGHLTVRDTIHGRESDFWQAKYNSTTGRITGASSGASFPLGYWAEHDAPCGWAGDAACFPLRRGLITPDNIASGTIDHPLVFSTPEIGGTSTSYRYPATHNSPTCGTSCTNHLPEGTWLRMDPTVSCTSYGLPSWQVEVCVALQNYGMFLRDNGGTMGIYGVDPINGGTQWSDLGLTGSSAAFSVSFPWSRLQVLSPPSA